jgi:hypothetical protein
MIQSNIRIAVLFRHGLAKVQTPASRKTDSRHFAFKLCQLFDDFQLVHLTYLVPSLKQLDSRSFLHHDVLGANGV